jgi:hypothetical protein
VHEPGVFLVDGGDGGEDVEAEMRVGRDVLEHPRDHERPAVHVEHLAHRVGRAEVGGGGGLRDHGGIGSAQGRPGAALGEGKAEHVKEGAVGKHDHVLGVLGGAVPDGLFPEVEPDGLFNDRKSALQPGGQRQVDGGVALQVTATLEETVPYAEDPGWLAWNRS